MRKILCYIITLTIALLCLGGVVRAENPVNTEENVKFTLLKELEIIPQKGLMTEYMTRADFAVYTARMLGINDFEKSDVRYFYDIQMNHYALKSINTLYELGIFSMGENKEFRPDDLISVDEACKILTVALGYGEYAEGNGGYPLGYRKVATSNDILNGIKSKDALSTNDALTMIYNTLKAEVFDYVIVSEGYVGKQTNGETVLSLYHDVFYDEGTVYSVEGEYIYSDTVAHENEVIIDNNIFDANDKYFGDFLGNYVEYFYKENDSANPKLLCMSVKGSKENVKFLSEDFIELKGDTLRFEENDKEKAVTLAKNKVVVYNGTALVSGIGEALKTLNYGEITLKSSNGNGYYDVIHINDYFDFYLTSKSEKDKLIADNVLWKNNIALDDFELVEFYDKNGEKLELAELTSGNILSVKISADNKLLRAVVSSNIVTGKLEAIKNDSKTSFKIGENWYNVSQSYHESEKNSFKIGTTLTYRLNINGDIVYAELPSTNGEMFGYLVASAVTDDGFEKVLNFRIFSQDGRLSEYSCIKKLVVDGKKYSNISEIAEDFPGVEGEFESVEPQLIRFTLRNGEINAIDTIGGDPLNEDKRYTLDKGNMDGAFNYSHFSGRFGMNKIVSSDTIHFLVPEDEYAPTSHVGKFKVSKANFLDQTNYPSIELYRLGTETDYYTVAVSRGSGQKLDDTRYIALVSEVSQVVDDDENVVYQLAVLQNGASVEYIVSDEVMKARRIPSSKENGDWEYTEINMEDVSVGDTLSFEISDGVITKIEMIYDYSERSKAEYGFRPDSSGWECADSVNGDQWYDGKAIYDNWTPFTPFQLSFGFVAELDGKMIKLGARSPEVITEVYDGQTSYMVYDSERDECYLGTIDDIKDYKTFSNNCSKVIIQTNRGRFRGLVVYN